MSTGLPEQWPRLLADIGGSNARFALETAPGVIEDIEVLPCAGYPTLLDAVRAYLDLAARARSLMPPSASPTRCWATGCR